MSIHDVNNANNKVVTSNICEDVFGWLSCASTSAADYTYIIYQWRAERFMI